MTAVDIQTLHSSSFGILCQRLGRRRTPMTSVEARVLCVTP